MRPRFALPLSVLAALAAGALPSAAAAHPVHNRGLTIGVTPNPIDAGDSVLIYGKLEGTDVANRPIVLYHRVNPHARYTVIQRTRTTSTGFYDFKRVDGVVMSNREWFVRGPNHTHSRTVHERVYALVNVSSSTSQTDTGTRVTFTGRIVPAHPNQPVRLQVQTGHEGNGWRTIRVARTNAGSAFSIPYRWRRPGVKTVRVLLGADPRNIASPSDSLTVTVQQRQAPGFTIASSQPVIPYGQTIDITGVLDKAASNVVEPDTSVTLYGRSAGGAERALATTVTGSDGAYAFNGMRPLENTVYRVVTTLTPRRHSAPLYQGVSDQVTVSASPTTAQIGQPVTFTGSVTPDKAGEWIYLERLGSDGFWHETGAHRIAADGSFTFARVFAQPGSREFRARIFADGTNVGAGSPPVTITVSDTVAPPATLPPAS